MSQTSTGVESDSKGSARVREHMLALLEISLRIKDEKGEGKNELRLHFTRREQQSDGYRKIK